MSTSQQKRNGVIPAPAFAGINSSRNPECSLDIPGFPPARE